MLRELESSNKPGLAERPTPTTASRPKRAPKPRDLYGYHLSDEPTVSSCDSIDDYALLTPSHPSYVYFDTQDVAIGYYQVPVEHLGYTSVDAPRSAYAKSTSLRNVNSTRFLTMTRIPSLGKGL